MSFLSHIRLFRIRAMTSALLSLPPWSFLKVASSSLFSILCSLLWFYRYLLSLSPLYPRQELYEAQPPLYYKSIGDIPLNRLRKKQLHGTFTLPLINYSIYFPPWYGVNRYKISRFGICASGLCGSPFTGNSQLAIGRLAEFSESRSEPSASRTSKCEIRK